MRTGISIIVTPSDRFRLEALVRERNAPQKQVWRAEIVLLSADGLGTNEIMHRTGKSQMRSMIGQVCADSFHVECRQNRLIASEHAEDQCGSQLIVI